MLSCCPRFKKGSTERNGQSQNRGHQRFPAAQSRTHAGCTGGTDGFGRNPARGLIPPWAKDRAIAHKLSNARAETIDEKRSFKQPFKKRRCLLPVDGYYEWENRSVVKQPVYYSLLPGDLFCLAGLWESWTEPVETAPLLPGLELGQAEPTSLHTFTLITTTPNRLAKRVHE
jgi:putative SOS response-associated peptidase YedK